MIRKYLSNLTPLGACCLIAVLSTPSSAQAQVACRYEVAATLSAGSCSLGERSVAAVAISPNGRYVCGFYCQCLCNPYESFVYDMQTGVMFTIPRPPGIFTSEANDVTDAGWVVGTMGGTPGDFGYIYDYPAHAYVGQIPSGVDGGICAITGINSSNTVCGTRGIGPGPKWTTSAFIKTANGPIVDLGLIDGWRTYGVAINDAGEMAVTKDYETAGYVWDGITLVPAPPLPRDAGFYAQCIGSAGQLYGRSGVYHVPIVFQNGATTPLPRLFGPASTGSVQAADSHNVVVGYCSPSDNWFEAHPCAWSNGEVIDLQPRIVSTVNLYLRSVDAISDTGLIVCNGVERPVILRPVPGLVGDVNCDSVVNRFDLLEVIEDWGFTQSNSDINHDLRVDVADLLLVIINWTY